MYGQYRGRGEQFVHCREVVHSSECPLSEAPLNKVLYITFRYLQYFQGQNNNTVQRSTCQVACLP